MPVPATARPNDRPRVSLFRSGLAMRLILAVVLSGLVWLGIAWALTA